ncbi:pyridoxamine 5'-phosphate oxidase family protein [Chthonobacter rhizosphaerae]|uniref:pyridoxamine 5'-phosphate oxidase family protein n=1 Tax=Chthonobacter rhizosphaerae TaxID=2735553 RepID=UPI0015EFDBE1|nr:pyridoxamine 5'-phosphate oxidase family protein [Chthonobacter rhizosphaerae]
MNASPFHPGELMAQALAGGGSGGAAIRDFMPDQHRQFFALLPALFACLPDTDGHPIATVLTGAPGFVTSPDERTLRVAAMPSPGDPAHGLLRPGTPVGLLGLEFETRRRNRANGTVTDADGDGFTVAVRQSFGNCAKYIQTRRLSPGPTATADAVSTTGLDPAAAALIGEADTFFVASRSALPDRDAGGLDISHRGGRPGFARITDGRLEIPDFRGNRYFDTLGNLLEDPRAGLLFLDFENGDLVHVQGLVQISWERTSDAPEGAERIWTVDVKRTIRRPAAMPLRGAFDAFAPTTLQTGDWS